MSLHTHTDFDHAAHTNQAGIRPDDLPRHSARQLTCGGTQAQIELDGKVYDLRITRAGKLILTK